MAEAPMLGLYVHIPFCVRKCGYCDFNSYAGLEALAEPYVRAVALEAAVVGPKVFGRRVGTVYIGGGTPSVLHGPQMARLLRCVHSVFAVEPDAEVTVEVNPDTVSLAKLKRFRGLGVNRLSIGIQALEDAHLRCLGRVHTARAALRSFALARDAGFANINVDLIYAIPEQSLADWRRTIQRVTQLRPEHVSAYALTLEDGTPMHRDMAEGRIALPPEELELAMAESAAELLIAAGYEHYEVSNFALSGRRSRHNQIYWRSEEYVGLGAGAHGYLDGCRYGNVAQPSEYIERAGAGRELAVLRERLPPAKALGEALMLGLRMREGVDLSELHRRFEIDPLQRYRRELDDLRRRGLIGMSNGRLWVTRAGLHLLDEVTLRFV